MRRHGSPRLRCVLIATASLSLTAQAAAPSTVPQPEPGSVSLIVWVDRRAGLSDDAKTAIEQVKPDFVALHGQWDGQDPGVDPRLDATNRALDWLAERRLPVRMLFYMAWFEGLPDELKAEVQLDQEGLPPDRGYGALSHWGPQSRPRFLAFVEHAVDQLRLRPGVVQWTFINGWSENYYTRSGYRRVFDYSPIAQAKFRWYLRERKGYSLADVGRRAGYPWASWEGVTAPQPVWDEVNLSPFWADWMDFRCWSALQQGRDVCTAVRRHESTRPIFVYGNNHPLNQAQAPALLPQFAELARRVAGGIYVTSGSATLFSAVSGTIAERMGLPLSNECGLPPESRDHYAFWLFNAIAHDATYFQLYTRLPLGDTEAIEELQLLRPVLRELAQAQHRPRRVGFLVSYATGMCHASWLPSLHHNHSVQPIWGRIANAFQASRRLHFELSPIPDIAPFNPFTGLDGVLEPGSVVLPASTMAALERFVRGGGRAVLFGDSGRYLYGAEGPREGHALATRLGYRTDDPWPTAPIQGMPGWIEPIYLSSQDGSKPEPPPAASLRAVAQPNGILRGDAFALAYPYVLPAPRFDCRVLATNGEGLPIALHWRHGKGEVVMLSGFPDHREESGFVLMHDLLAWLGATPVADGPRMVAVCHKMRGEAHYFASTNHGRDQPGAEARVRLMGLPGGKSFVIDQFGLPVAVPAQASSRQLMSEGLPLSLAPFQTVIIRLTPAPQ